MKKYFSVEFLKELSLTLKEQVYGPGEIIFNTNDNDKKMYFIVKGNVDIFLDNSSNKT